MKSLGRTPINYRNTILASAIALVLCNPAYAADSAPSASQYDATVDYSGYRATTGTYKLRASDVIGRDVRNAADETIGEIDDLIVSRDGDKVLAVVSLGKFFELNSKLILIPYEQLRVTKDGKHIYFNASKDDLNSRTAFTYADGERPAIAGKRDDNVTAADDVPASAEKDADNSARNARDRGGDTLTPLDQSTENADVEITRNIRKRLVDDESLGINAQNVKVITADGNVTLRGPVGSTAEKARVVAVAKQAAGTYPVQDELEVINR